GLSRLFCQTEQRDAGPLEDRFYHVGRHSLPSGPLGEPPWSWVEAKLGFRKTAVGLLASAVCRHTLAGRVLAKEGRKKGPFAGRRRRLPPRPTKSGRESGVETTPKGGTGCPDDDNPAHKAWPVTGNGESPLSTVLSCQSSECTERRAWMH